MRFLIAKGNLKERQFFFVACSIIIFFVGLHISKFISL